MSNNLFVPANLKFDGENNSGGVLSIAGCSAEKLVNEYGSPLFVIDQADFYAGKLQACRWFFRYELPKVDAQLALLASLDTTSLTMQDNWF